MMQARGWDVGELGYGLGVWGPVDPVAATLALPANAGRFRPAPRAHEMTRGGAARPENVPARDPAAVVARTGGAAAADPRVAAALRSRITAVRHPHMRPVGVDRSGRVAAQVKVHPCVGCGPKGKGGKGGKVRAFGSVEIVGPPNPNDPEWDTPITGTVPTTTKPAPDMSATGGWPAPPGFRPGNWDFTHSTYVLAFGDTLSGLSTLYLGTPQRWKEIWQLQPFRFTRSPDKLMAGEKLIMPFEARDRAKAMLGNTQAVPSTTGNKAPIPVAGEDPNAPTAPGATAALAESKIKKALPWIAGAAAVLGVGFVALK